MKLDLKISPPAAPRRAASEDSPPACERCAQKITKIGNDGNETRFAVSTGYIPLGAKPTDAWGTAEGLRAALERGDCCLCICDRGREWRDWFRELSRPLTDRDGRPVPTGFRLPTRGIPEFAERAA